MNAGRSTAPTPAGRADLWALTYSVFAAGLCSIVYELLIATTVAYFEGDSVTYFSLTIGLYMAAMGAGAYASKALHADLIAWFVAIEIVLALAGGGSVALLYLVFAGGEWFLATYVLLTLVIGFLIGLEIPLLTRVLQDYAPLRVNIAHVLSLDYLGALVASVAFPLLLLPWFGVLSSAVVVGLANITIAVVVAVRFRATIGRWRTGMTTATAGAGLALVLLLATGDHVIAFWGSRVYDGRVLHAERSRFQEIALTRFRGDTRLYLDGNLQFSSVDEHRYHEALAHVPVLMAGHPRDILLLGGGDGLAVRELLKHDGVRSITVVELDAAVISLAKEHPVIRALNGDSLTRDPRVAVLVADALQVLGERRRLYDVVIADLPDPNNPTLARLYTREFYQLARQNLSPSGVFVTQATSPYYAHRAFRAIHATVAAVFEHTLPYHVWVPSFGDWGFIVASSGDLQIPTETAHTLPPTRFLTRNTLGAMFVMDPDRAGNEPVEVSTFDRPAILSYYLAGWRQWLN